MCLVPPPLDIIACEILSGKGAASIGRTTDECHREPLKPLDLVVEELYEPGGVSPTATTAPAPSKDTASIKLISVAERAATAEPEALDHGAEGEDGSGLQMALRDDMSAGEWVLKPPPHEQGQDRA
jgi:hypothetical protein